MSISKFIAAAAMALLLAIPGRAQDSTSETLTNSNGLAAGKALLSLYNQYKADGKIDLSNASNITNIAAVVTNIEGLTKNANVKNFVSGLISGSKNLINNVNVDSVISTLSSIAGLDASSIASSVATSAAKGLLSKLGGGKSETTVSNSATTAANVLSTLFAGLSK